MLGGVGSGVGGVGSGVGGVGSGVGGVGSVTVFFCLLKLTFKFPTPNKTRIFRYNRFFDYFDEPDIGSFENN